MTKRRHSQRLPAIPQPTVHECCLLWEHVQAMAHIIYLLEARIRQLEQAGQDSTYPREVLQWLKTSRLLSRAPPT